MTTAKSTQVTSAVARRALLRTALAGGATTAAAIALPPGASAEAATAVARQVPGVPTPVDTSHATPEVVRFFDTYFRAKSAPDLDGFMSHFAGHRPFRYIDAVLGASLDHQALHDVLAAAMPAWTPDLNSYATRIVGDASGALVLFNDVAGLFGKREIRVVSAIDIRQHKIVRQVDYWDGRHFGIAETRDLARAFGVTTFPTDFWVRAAGEGAAPRMQRTVDRLNTALSSGHAAAAIALFAPDAVYEDITTHLSLTGTQSIGRYLHRTVGLLPYATPSTAVRHVLGSGRGGGYEWTSRGDVPRGVTVLELSRSGRITRLTAAWDGAHLSDAELVRLMRLSIER